jgi:protein-L-isoaspartate(D-aspartate) O-methyltransferase
MRPTGFAQQREWLIDVELRSLGIADERVLAAMRSVPREAFLLDGMAEFAYLNVPLPISGGQTISQPWVVARMAEAMELRPTDCVLEVGAGSGYAAAVLSRLAAEVVTIERLSELAALASERLKRLHFDNVTVHEGDGTLGWPARAPFDAIVVAAGGPRVPPALLEQLAIGGRLVIPVGEELESQEMVRITRRGPSDYQREVLEQVRFVPLIGAAGWDATAHPATSRPAESRPSAPRFTRAVQPAPRELPDLIRHGAEPFLTRDDIDWQACLDRIGDSRLVLIGEASHGTSEFYRLRAALTQQLIEKKQFNFVAVEADWPDAYRIHDYVTHRQREEPHEWEAFSRFPTWMWRNHEVLDFIHWLRDHNLAQRSSQRVGFFGLDLYSMYTSIRCVIEYLQRVDPAAAEIARTRYACLTPWEADPGPYGRAALSGRYRSCEREVVQMLLDLSRRRVDAALRNGEDLLDAQLNARLVADAEHYYRLMYYGSDESWNHRDTHMFETLRLLLDRYGPQSKAILWAHNSHLGDASATQFGKHGQLNIGQLCRESFGDQAYLIGQGTDRGHVAAASEWDGPLEIKAVRPSRSDSYEQAMHQAGLPSFLLPLRMPLVRGLREALDPPRLERAIGVIYRPETERQSHYFYASLANQFDEWIWVDETSAVKPLPARVLPTHEPRHPFATLDE